MALDGVTQLLGWRESTWELRVSSGLLFGLASAWFVYPRIEDAFGNPTSPRQYAPAEADPCAPPPVPNRLSQLG
jgi:hypothetical protein